MTHFDILYMNSEQTCPEQFPVRVTFLSEAAELVVQKCEEQQTMKNDQRLVRWIKRLLSFVSEVEEEKCFNPLVVTSPGQSKHASRKHPERLQDVQRNQVRFEKSALHRFAFKIHSKKKQNL